MQRSAFFALLFSGLVVFGLAADPPTAGKQWWQHILYLADDKLEGRETGSPGHRKAAEYVAGQFERAGLKAAGEQGYIQPVRLTSKSIDESQSSLAILRNGQAEAVKLGEEAYFSMRSDPAASVEAPAVFAGYGLSIPERGHDDLAGLDVKGKIVVTLTGVPAGIPGTLTAHATSQRWKSLKARGALGTAILANPKSMDIPWARAMLARFSPAMDLDDAALRDNTGMQVAITLNPAYGEKFLAGSGHTFAELLALADARKPLPHFPLAIGFRAKQSVKFSPVESQNVVGVHEGADPKVKNEVVVFSAHLDHIGVGKPINGDSIYNGAMDNASGIAALIEIARGLQKKAIRRSIAFVAVTGEEKGLLGSRYFANHPTLANRTIVADINMDMFLPLFPLRLLSVQGVDESSLGADIRAVAEKAGVTVMGDTEPERNLFIRSDQYSFVRRGVPALAFKFGWVKGSAEEKIQKEWLKNRYHAPSDDVNQPVAIEDAGKFLEILMALAARVGDAAERPAWRDDSFFKRFAP